MTLVESRPKLRSVHICGSDVVRALFKDLGVDTFTTQYVVKRTDNEGVLFLTRVLPCVAKCLLIALEKGYFSYSEYSELSAIARKGKFPIIFFGFFSRIFSHRTGKVLEYPDAGAIYIIRQACEYFYKLAIPYSDDQLDSALEKFLGVEEELSTLDSSGRFVDQLRKDVCRFYPELSSTHYHRVLQRSKPRPGPGTYAGCKPGEWWRHKKKILPVFPVKGTDIPFEKSLLSPKIRFRSKSAGVVLDQLRSPTAAVVSRDTASSSELLFVPKDSRGPRTIVREPFHALRYQMSFHDWFKEYLENKTSHRINFVSQEINKNLAKESSITQLYATLDLQDASDRTAYSIVRKVYRDSSLVQHFLQYRTRECYLPNGTTIQLNKLSGMGSGFTFPIMSHLLHLAISREICDACRRELAAPDSSGPKGLQEDRLYRQISRQVYVYGDDIIVPTKWVHHAIHAVQKIGYRVNKSKSFARSHFRESCGGDYFRGVDVAPVRARFSNARPVVHKGSRILFLNRDFSLLAVERHCRELVEKGLMNLSSYYYDLLSFLRLPSINARSQCLGVVSPSWADNSLRTDRSGNFRRVLALLPGAKKDSFKGDPFIYLDNYISKEAAMLPEYEFLIAEAKTDARVRCSPGTYLYEPSEPFSRLDIPRTIELRPKVVAIC